jgi:hypothetical protein
MVQYLLIKMRDGQGLRSAQNTRLPHFCSPPSFPLMSCLLFPLADKLLFICQEVEILLRILPELVKIMNAEEREKHELSYLSLNFL